MIARVGTTPNATIADKLDEVAALLSARGNHRFRIAAYRRAAGTLRGLARPVAELLAESGVAGLESLPGIGPSLAGAIAELARTGDLHLLTRLRRDRDPLGALMSLPGVGERTVDRLVHEMGIVSLEDLEMALADGRLARAGGFGAKRLAVLRDVLATRLAPVSTPPRNALTVPVAELLELDREYRDRVATHRLRQVAPRRFNPRRESWLPVLTARRGERRYTVSFSNTARAHRIGKTHTWVQLRVEDRLGTQLFTVITAEAGPLQGRRIVRGREDECALHYAAKEAPAISPAPPSREPEQTSLVFTDRGANHESR